MGDDSHSMHSRKRRRPCAVCGKILNRNAAKFCSNKCQRASQWAKCKSEIEATGVAPFVRSAKKYLLERDGPGCQLCGNTQWQGRPIPILLDHINGDAADWAVSNLRLICPNCDALLPTFKNRNKGRGRFARLQRYRQGLSY